MNVVVAGDVVGWIVQTPSWNLAGVVSPLPSKSPIKGVPVPPKRSADLAAPVVNPERRIQRCPLTSPGFAAVGWTTRTGRSRPPRTTRSTRLRLSVDTGGGPIGPLNPTEPPTESVVTRSSARGALPMSARRPSNVVAVLGAGPSKKSPRPKPPPTTCSEPRLPAVGAGTLEDNGTIRAPDRRGPGRRHPCRRRSPAATTAGRRGVTLRQTPSVARYCTRPIV